MSEDKELDEARKIYDEKGNSDKLTPKEIAEIEKLLEEREEKRGGK